MAIGDLTALPVELQNLIQEKAFARVYKEALYSEVAYSLEASREELATQIGARMVFTRLSELPASRLALDPASMTGLDNGLTPDTFINEQYDFRVAKYAKTVDIDLIAQKAIIASYVKNVVGAQGRQAARIREAVCKYKLFKSYQSGNTVVTSKVAATTTSCHVDDITGFGYVMRNGEWINVGTGTGQQLAVVNKTASARSFNVTGVVPDSTSATPETDVANTSSRKSQGGVSGVLNFTAIAGAPVAGDVLRAVNASEVMRPNGKATTQALASGDILTTAVMMQAKQKLAARGVRPYANGFYRCILPATSMTHLFADAGFQNATVGQVNSPEMRFGRIARFQGIEYVESTEALTQAAASGADGAAVAVAVNRPILLGENAIVRGDYKGLEEFAKEQNQRSSVHDVHFFDGICFTMRSPLDRLGLQMASSHLQIMDFTTPCDATSTPDLMPSTDYSAYKRGIVIEHAV